MENASSEALLKKLYNDLIDARKELNAAQKHSSLDMAVVGVACRFPGGVDSLETFWELLSSGRDPIGPIPASRWDHAEFFDSSPDATGKVYSREGGFVDDVAHFDATFFDISPREAAEMDPQQRMLLELSWEAFRQAGQDLLAMKGSNTGVFIGMSTDDYAGMTMHNGDHCAIDAYNSLGTARSVAAGRIAYTWGFHGPVIQVDTACSSSLVALHFACQSIASGDCEQALVAGINLMLSPEVHIACSRLRALSPSSRCKVFDDSADGYVRSEGAGCVLVKSLHRALADGDRIMGVIRSCAINHDGKSNGLTAPNGRAQVQLIRKALKRAGLQPANIGYVELHGTGTRLGDPIEVHALGDALQRKGRHTSAKSPLLLGSVKSNIGHLEAAAGMASLLKAILIHQKGVIPANLHYETPNRQIRWEHLDVNVVDKSMAWPQHPDADLIGISAFGLSGTNVHVILGPAPNDIHEAQDAMPRGCHLLTLSGRNEDALREQMQQSQAILAQLPDSQFADWCSAHAVHGAHFQTRKAVVASSRSEMTQALNQALNASVNSAVTHVEQICFVFTGQGSQYSGMGRELVAQVPAFKRHMDALAPRFEAIMGLPLAELWWGEYATQLNQTQFTQPALFAFEYCLAKTLMEWQIKPDVCLGHSVGEYVAACIAGLLSLDDALRCIALRARCMAECDAKGVMVAVLAPSEQVILAIANSETALPHNVAIAAYNSPNSTVISGDDQAVLRLMNQLTEQGVRCIQLDVSHAFHSPLMQPAAEAFLAQLPALKVQEGELPVISNVTANLLKRHELTPAYLAQHIIEPVRFTESIRCAVEMGVNVFIEIGPKSTLSQLLTQIVRDVVIHAIPAIVQPKQPLHSLWQCVGKAYELGVNPAWKKVFDGARLHHVQRIDYPFNRQRLWTRSSKRKLSPVNKSHSSLYEMHWCDVPDTSAKEATGDWLQLQWHDGVAQRIEQGMTDAGAWVHCLSMNDIELDRWLSETMSLLISKPWRGLIITIENAETISDERFDERCTSTLQKMLFIARLFNQVESVANEHHAQPEWLARGVWVVVAGAVGALALMKEALQGFTKGVSLEKRRAWGGVIDIDEGHEVNCAVLARTLLGDECDVLRLRGSVLQQPRLQSISPRAGIPLQFTHEDAVLVAGGTGGIGLQICEWLVERGLRRLLVVGRREWDALDHAKAVFKQLTENGVQLVYRSLDIADAEQLNNAVTSFEAENGRLTGFVHAAGVAALRSVEQLDAETLASTLDGKMKGAWFLHQLSLQRDTRCFVLCSSIASVWGGANLAHYAAANACLDGLATIRLAQKLPVHCIQWGPWKESGMARDTITHDMSRMGVRGFDNASARKIFQQVIDATCGTYIAVDADWNTLSRTFAASHRAQLFERLVSDSFISSETANASTSTKKIAKPIHTLDANALRAHVTEVVVSTLTQQLQLDRARIRLETPLTELGLDSILAVEMGRAFEAALGLSLPATLLFDAPNAQLLIDNLCQRFPKPVHTNVVAPKPLSLPLNREKVLTSMIQMIRQLDDSELDQLLSA